MLHLRLLEEYQYLFPLHLSSLFSSFFPFCLCLQAALQLRTECGQREQGKLLIFRQPFTCHGSILFIWSQQNKGITAEPLCQLQCHEPAMWQDYSMWAYRENTHTHTMESSREKTNKKKLCAMKTVEINSKIECFRDSVSKS